MKTTFFPYVLVVLLLSYLPVPVRTTDADESASTTVSQPEALISGSQEKGPGKITY